MPGDGLLLDTCAVIWISQGIPLRGDAERVLRDAERDGVPIRVSPVTAWELGILVARGRLTSSRPPLAWFEDFVDETAVELTSLTPEILVAASFLPGKLHGDPMDRILIATARIAGLTIVTRDRAILQYADQGHVRALSC